MIIEKGYSISESLGILWKNKNLGAIATGLVATLFSTMGPGMIVFNAANSGNLTDAQAVSWLLGIYLIGGLATIFMSLRYRLPVVTAFTIPGAVMLAKILPNFTLSEAVGAYIVVGVVTLILTISGLMKKFVEHIPVPVMLGMVGGVLLSFGIGMFTAAIKMPQVYGFMVISFFGIMAFKSFAKKVPPIIVAIIVGIVALAASNLITPVPLSFEISKPVLALPTFSLRAILDISFPLFFLVIGVQNIQAVGVLMAANYKVPINAMYLVPAIGTFINSLFGAHPAVTAGPSTAICAGPSAGEKKEHRFIAAFAEGVFWVSFALLAKIIVESVKMVPKEFTAVLAGLAMFEVFKSAFQGAFAGRFRTGALVAFFVAVTNLSILNIGAPLWAIILGLLTSLIVEREDFKLNKTENGKLLETAK
ncbi:benzoate/H(+) symporter BenE family transporter [Sporomusa acidovorans]|uniref:Inner membrane protein YdcO n=1 Tax=Sporomusa acidovorans (strain ATCC 49682 / DSM 3132 / Mol) TaxID=1123286 RepID=A0ABZ3J503_SPOA4|nr:benzoate/H(+) symporter BenE family transporter [Sporomusa acidovorans]OZC15593.1 inner membrane protein YdcO [Sporomusa acidovorans DSM 3132]SDE19123.1 benzoate membrane transport protein [Sporomusa acidovorans]